MLKSFDQYEYALKLWILFQQAADCRRERRKCARGADCRQAGPRALFFLAFPVLLHTRTLPPHSHSFVSRGTYPKRIVVGGAHPPPGLPAVHVLPYPAAPAAPRPLKPKFILRFAFSNEHERMRMETAGEGGAGPGAAMSPICASIPLLAGDQLFSHLQLLSLWFLSIRNSQPLFIQH